MIKRLNKITAILVAATSIMSVVPAMASERLGTKDGTITSGIAFDEGKYIYDGYRTDDDNNGIYYNNGNKDKLLDDLDDYNIVGKYGTKYLFAEDGSKQYLVDLTTGKVLDNETDEEKKDTVQGELRSRLKRTNRYSNTNAFDDVTVYDRLFTGNKQFGDVWYMYSANGDENYTTTTTTAAVAAKVTVTLPTEGAVIDGVAGTYSIKIGDVTYKKGTGTNTATEIYFSNYTDLKNLVKSDLDAWLNTNIKTAATATTPAAPIFNAVNPADITTDPHSNTITALATSDTITLTNSQIDSINSRYGKYSAANAKAGTSVGQSNKYMGLTNDNGKYIDTSNLANIYAYSKKADRVVKVEEYDDYDKDNEIIVNLKDMKPIAQDKDYIYAITTVTIGQGSTEADARVDAKASRSRYFYQKISKSQGDKKDEAYIPKTVDSYEIDNKSFYDDNDAEDAYNAMLTDNDGYEAEKNMYTVKNGALYVVRIKDDKVKIFKMKTKKAKVDAVDTADVKDKDKNLDAPLVEKADDSDHDIFDGAGQDAVSIDVDGNVWILDKGAIYKVDGTDFKEIYTLDRSIDNLDVYNDGSLIAWENKDGDDGKVYTTVTEGKAATQSEAPVVTPPQTKTGWNQLTDGSWNFYDANGNKVVNNFINVGGLSYYLDANGTMATGWKEANGIWYYFNPISDGTRGAMKTGWVNDNGTWYYLNSYGIMQTGWFKDTNGTWYYLNPISDGTRGAMKTGWVNDYGTWYYLYSDGSMAYSTKIGGYRLSSSGALI